MADDKDRLQQAADALDALGPGPSPAAQPAPAPDAAPPPPPPVPPAQSPVIHVTVKTPSTVPPPHLKFVVPDTKVKPPKPPRPTLTRFDQMTLDKRIALRRTAIPLLLTTGLVMLLLGGWAILVLAFGLDPLRGDVTFQTRYLAKRMLLAWPVAAILLAGTAFLMHEVYNHYEAMQPEPPDDQ